MVVKRLGYQNGNGNQKKSSEVNKNSRKAKKVKRN